MTFDAIQHATRCPCCGLPTLPGPEQFAFCVICWWEDDPPGRADPDTPSGGPNGKYSLAQGRANYARWGVYYDPTLISPGGSGLRDDFDDPVVSASKARAIEILSRADAAQDLREEAIGGLRAVRRALWNARDEQRWCTVLAEAERLAEADAGLGAAHALLTSMFRDEVSALRAVERIGARLPSVGKRLANVGRHVPRLLAMGLVVPLPAVEQDLTASRRQPSTHDGAFALTSDGALVLELWRRARGEAAGVARSG